MSEEKMMSFASGQHFLSQFMAYKIAIYLPTQCDYNLFMQFLDNNGVVWRPGGRTTEDNYFPADPFFTVGLSDDKRLVWGNALHFLKDGFIIIPYAQIREYIEKELKGYTDR